VPGRPSEPSHKSRESLGSLERFRERPDVVERVPGRDAWHDCPTAIEISVSERPYLALTTLASRVSAAFAERKRGSCETGSLIFDTLSSYKERSI
jgi:hypothetical protein